MICFLLLLCIFKDSSNWIDWGPIDTKKSINPPYDEVCIVSLHRDHPCCSSGRFLARPGSFGVKRCCHHLNGGGFSYLTTHASSHSFSSFSLPPSSLLTSFTSAARLLFFLIILPEWLHFRTDCFTFGLPILKSS